MSNIIRLGGGGGSLQVGEITLKDKSGDSNFLKCEGQEVNVSDYPELFSMMSYSVGQFTGRIVLPNYDDNSYQGGYIYDIIYAKGLFVAVGDGGGIRTSPDGITWTARDSGLKPSWSNDSIYYSLRRVIYANGIFVVVGGYESSYKYILTSPDGITWTHRTTSSLTAAPYSITYGNGLFVAGLYNGSVATSPDGITWTTRTTGNTTRIYNIAYGNNVFVFGVYGNTMLFTSSDGVNWSSKTISGITDSIGVAAYGNEMWVVVDSSGNIACSKDLNVWEVISPIVYDYQGKPILFGFEGRLIYSGGRWLFTTNYNFIAIAPDLHSKFTPLYVHTYNSRKFYSLCIANDLLIAGCHQGDIYTMPLIKVLPYYEVDAYIKAK